MLPSKIVAPFPRPRIVTVVGVTCFWFSIVGIASFVFLAVTLSVGRLPEPYNRLTSDRVWLFRYFVTIVSFGLPMVIGLLIGSVGILRLQPWARRLVMLLALLMLIASLADAGVQHERILPLARSLPPATQPDERRMDFLLTPSGLIASVVVGWGIGISLFCSMLLPSVRHAFARYADQSELHITM
jgi:hypothetical protein